MHRYPHVATVFFGRGAVAKAWKDQQLAEYVSKPYFYTENGVWAPAARVSRGRCCFVLLAR